MNFKHFIRSAVFLAGVLAVLSCNKDGMGGPKASVRFRIVTPETETKASVTPYEARVGSLDLLAFRALDGTLDGEPVRAVVVAPATTLTTISGDVTSNVALNCYVVANAPDGAFSGITSESAFLAALSRLDHSTSNSLVMVGKSLNMTVTSSDSSEDIEITRLGCKVSVGTVSMSAAYYSGLGASPTVTIGRVVLANVVGSIPYSQVPAAGSVWYNQRGVLDATGIVADLTEFTSGAAITGSSPVSVNADLYCYPNPTSNSVDSSNDGGTWSARKTRAAIEVIVNGNPEWYPVTLPAMDCNKHYRIKTLTILGPGSTSPDIPVTRTDLAFTVSVNAWSGLDVPIDFN